MNKARIQRWTCPNHCGWSRSWTNTPDWYEAFIQHPYYGWTRQGNVVRRDIISHDCRIFAEWQVRKVELGWGETPHYDLSQLAIQEVTLLS